MVSPILDKQCDTTTFLYSFATSTIKLEHKNYLYPRAKTHYDVVVCYLLYCLSSSAPLYFNIQRQIISLSSLSCNEYFVCTPLDISRLEAFSITIDQFPPILYIVYEYTVTQSKTMFTSLTDLDRDNAGNANLVIR